MKVLGCYYEVIARVLIFDSFKKRFYTKHKKTIDY